MLSDEQLMRELCAGQNDALRVLFERHSGLAFSVAHKMLRDVGEAEEVVNIVFLKIFRARDNFDVARGNFKTWFLQYVYHSSMDRKQSLSLKRFYDSRGIEDAADIATKAPSPDIVSIVEQALRSLEERQRTVIELTYFEGLTAIEVAERTRRTPQAVRNDLYRALSTMRDALTAKPKAAWLRKLAPRAA